MAWRSSTSAMKICQRVFLEKEKVQNIKLNESTIEKGMFYTFNQFRTSLRKHGRIIELHRKPNGIVKIVLGSIFIFCIVLLVCR